MRVLICGGRHFEGAETVHRELVRLHWQHPIQVLIHGSVTGVGIAAEAWARRNGVSVVRYPPNWEYFGKRAESIRNAFMLEDGRPDIVVSFPGGKHTADLVHRASESGVRVISVSPDGQPFDTKAPEAPDPLLISSLHAIQSPQPKALSCASAETRPASKGCSTIPGRSAGIARASCPRWTASLSRSENSPTRIT